MRSADDRKSEFQTLRGSEKILVALSEFGYLTASQITKLLYAPSSQSYVQKQLKYLVTGKYVMLLTHRFVTQPRVYTLTGKGQSALTSLGVRQQIRIRPTEEKAKAHNFLFLQHTIAVTDVLIAAKLLSQTVPDIQLTRMYTERELKRTIYVEIPEKICIEPDASCEFEITVSTDGNQHIGVDFFHIEVYRTLPPVEWRFKQKIKEYVTYALTGQHEALFQTPALSIAVLAPTEQMAATLKRWTEEALQEMERPEEGEWFFFYSLDPATASPEELYLTPVCERHLGLPRHRFLYLRRRRNREINQQGMCVKSCKVHTPLRE